MKYDAVMRYTYLRCEVAEGPLHLMNRLTDNYQNR